MQKHLLLLPLLAGLISCAPLARLNMPGELRCVPGKGGDLEKLEVQAQTARDLWEKGEPHRALELLDEVLEQEPMFVPAHRVRQEILRRRGRLALLMREAEDRLAESPEDARAHYLAGRIRAQPQAKLGAFKRALELQPEFYWGWFGLAYVLRRHDPEQANRIYDRLYETSAGERLTAVAYASSLIGTGEPHRAYKVFSELEKRAPGVGALGMAEIDLQAGKRHQAFRHLLQALEARPYDPGAVGMLARLVGEGLRDDELGAVLDSLRGRAGKLELFAEAGGGRLLLAKMFRQAGEPHAALEVLEQVPARRWLRPGQSRMYQELLISTGDAAGYLRDLAGSVPKALIADEGNQLRGLWRELFDGAWMQAADPLADLGQVRALLVALSRVGRLKDAVALATVALRRHGQGAGGARGARGAGGAGGAQDAKALRPALTELRQELRSEIAFEAGLRRLLLLGYMTYRTKGQGGSLAGLLDRCRELSQRVLGREVVGQPRIYEVPFAGDLLDPFSPGLGQHLARYNKHLVLGQRSGGPVEGLLLSRLSLREVEAVEGLSLPPNCREVIGERRQVTPVTQADLAGIALLNHYVVDMDEVRSWARGILRRRELAREDGKVLLGDDLPRKLSAEEPAGVEWRLCLLSPVEDSQLQAAVLDLIRWHELGHMVDFLHYLPVTSHPLRALALVTRNAFSPLAISGEMEGRAEIMALAHSPHSKLILAHIAGFLEGVAGDSPHAEGFRRLAQGILEAQHARGEEQATVRHWHRLRPEVVRQIGRELLQRLW